MRRRFRWLFALAALALVFVGATATPQSRGSIIFVRRRPPRELTGNLRGWAQANATRGYAEDTTSHVWRVQFMAFLPRPPNTPEVTLVFYKIEPNRTRRYVHNEPMQVDPTQAIFYGQATLHRSPDEFQPMERYEVAITVQTSRGAQELARGTVDLTGQVERHTGVVDFTGSAPTAQ